MITQIHFENFTAFKDLMANAPGFRSLCSLRNIHFQEAYADIIDRAFLAALKEPMDVQRKIAWHAPCQP